MLQAHVELVTQGAHRATAHHRDRSLLGSAKYAWVSTDIKSLLGRPHGTVQLVILFYLLTYSRTVSGSCCGSQGAFEMGLAGLSLRFAAAVALLLGRDPMSRHAAAGSAMCTSSAEAVGPAEDGRAGPG